MFGHSGWCATLEDWLDPRRTHEDYVPTGFKPYGAKTYAVKGHPFGLDVSTEDRKALIAFLKDALSLRVGAPIGRELCSCWISRPSITSGTAKF